jgi:hypothetical protein
VLVRFASIASTEAEDYSVDLDGVTRLELSIIPNIGGPPVRATLAWINISQTPKHAVNTSR